MVILRIGPWSKFGRRLSSYRRGHPVFVYFLVVAVSEHSLRHAILVSLVDGLTLDRVICGRQHLRLLYFLAVALSRLNVPHTSDGVNDRPLTGASAGAGASGSADASWGIIIRLEPSEGAIVVALARVGR